MLPFEDRYSRQRRLAEVGRAGQDQLARASLAVRASADGSDVLELLYLHRAGVGRVDLLNTGPVASFGYADRFDCEAARALAAGAHRALLQLRAELGVG
jgi:molybdopterin/thiamine biosynthesis adenylyltransferase